MNITSKASITVSAQLSQVDISDALIEAVRSQAVKGGGASGMVLADWHVTIGDGGTSATVELVYEKSDAPAAQDASPAPQPAEPVADVPVPPTALPVGLGLPSAVG